MKKLVNDPINRLAAYAALILVSALPFSLDAYAEAGNEKKSSSQTVSSRIAKFDEQRQDEPGASQRP